LGATCILKAISQFARVLAPSLASAREFLSSERGSKLRLSQSWWTSPPSIPNTISNREEFWNSEGVLSDKSG